MTRLFPEVLASFATGCDGWDWHDDAWRGRRMPLAMQPIYEASEGSRIRMACTSGVRLRFASDTGRLWVQLRYGVHPREVFAATLLVDGQPVQGFGPQPGYAPQWEGTVYDQPSQTGVKKVFDLWLPHLAQVDVVEMRIDEQAFIEPADPLPIRWLAYGDSITQGMTSTLPTTSAVGLAALHNHAEVLNLAVGGAKLVAELATTIPAGEFDVISVAYGTNDFNQGVPVEDYQQHAQALVDALSQRFGQTPILLVTPLTWAQRTAPNALGASIQDYRDALTPVAQSQRRVRLIDGRELVEDDPSQFVDMVHPNDAGFARYGRLLGKAIEDALADV